MFDNMLSKEELEALLHDDDHGKETSVVEAGSRLETGEKDKLLHAVVRNQLRLLRMIDELQAEVHSLRSQVISLAQGGASSEAVASAEPVVPLPFMDRRQEEEKTPQPATAQLSRKERHKRNSIW
ncbi:hypothetical protein [Paenibacillus alkalitolerans]|uniref:hypothetical protein n=1 Tax=Paenibacillus alkalitolerans TaxID=2799335 RepID=UPI0018F64805|nr:hypothetical protein [Paenibacillus alkalitolerans]